MKRTLLSLFVLITGFSVAEAQVSMSPHFSAGIEYGQATGAISSFYGPVVGASAKFELPVANPNFEVTLTAGFSEYLVKLGYDGPLNLKAESFMPLETGVRYYFSRIAYFEADGGVSLNNQSGYTGPSSAFIYSPVIGVSAPTNKHKNTIDVGLRYESRNGGSNQVALRLAYRFGSTFPKENESSKGKIQK